ncbi:sialin [Agrilus planipennis]|uniref:Sialin n=1 Tax=Agrilus planipennis TaxID=224129 RepID=A0A7F5RKB4_AGRPL|nr:sialin [Agrilus planipennis]
MSYNCKKFQDGPFIWSTTEQGTMLSAYFWGYLVAQLPGGRVAELFSAKWVMFFSVAINVICTLLTPLMAELHFGAMLTMRILEGIGGGVTFPAMHVMLAHWAPPSERGTISSIVYAGTALGTVILMLVSGVIAGGYGWAAIFYIEGAVCAIWLILWAVFTADSPNEHWLISEEEREYINSSLNTGKGSNSEKKKLQVPWKNVWKSLPFWAILVAHTCSNWGWYMVLIELPYYMKSVLKFKIAENAVLTALPFFIMWIFSIGLSKTLDTLRTKGKITTTISRKIATLIASVIPMVCFIVLSYIGCRRLWATVLMTVAITSVGGMFCGFLSNHIDIAPNFAGTLVAITNSIATIPGIVVPVFVGKLTATDPTIASWRIIFWTTVCLYVIEAIVYTVFGSGEMQDWNKVESQNNDDAEGQPLKSSSNQSYDTADKTSNATLEVK